MRQLLGVKSSEFNRSQKRLNIGRELFFDDSKFDLSFCDEFQVENCALGSRKKSLPWMETCLEQRGGRPN